MAAGPDRHRPQITRERTEIVINFVPLHKICNNVAILK